METPQHEHLIKPTRVTFVRNRFPSRKLVVRTTALLVSLTLMTETTFILHAQSPQKLTAKAALVSWPVQSNEGLIFVTADSPSSSVWTPWGAPTLNDRGNLCVVAPTPITAGQQYVKTVAGTEFADDFDPPKWPYATKGQWRPYFFNAADANRYVITNESGALQIRSTAPAVDGRLYVLPPGPDVKVGDFSASVDILNWDTNVVGLQIAIFARGYYDPNNPSASNGYLGGVNVNVNGNQGKARLFVFDGVSLDPSGAIFDVTPGASYRLFFSGVGNALSTKLINLSDEEAPAQERQRTGTMFSAGAAGLFLDATSNLLEVTLDNYFVAGTKP